VFDKLKIKTDLNGFFKRFVLFSFQDSIKQLYYYTFDIYVCQLLFIFIIIFISAFKSDF